METILQDHTHKKDAQSSFKQKLVQAMKYSFVLRMLSLDRQNSILSGSFFFSTLILIFVQSITFLRSFLFFIPHKKLLLLILFGSIFITFQLLHYLLA